MMDRAIKSNIIFISYIYFPLLCFFIANTIMSTILKSTKKCLFSRFHENLLLNFLRPHLLIFRSQDWTISSASEREKRRRCNRSIGKKS